MGFPGASTQITERQLAIAELQKLQIPGDPEAAHSVADKVLCALLITLGYRDVVDEFNKVEKWYA